MILSSKGHSPHKVLDNMHRLKLVKPSQATSHINRTSVPLFSQPPIAERLSTYQESPRKHVNGMHKRVSSHLPQAQGFKNLVNKHQKS
jgi:hypothetical protein